MPTVTMYTTPSCVYCKMAKEYFVKNNVAFTEHDVWADEKARAEMLQKSGQMGVPVITVDDAVIVGFDRSRLATLLHIK